jgi:prevent-host-death family protein
MTFMEQVIGAFQARRKFGKLLRDVEIKRDPIVVERNGEPVAVLVPIDLYNHWKRECQEIFDSMRMPAERANMPDEEASEFALEVQPPNPSSLDLESLRGAAGSLDKPRSWQELREIAREDRLESRYG